MLSIYILFFQCLASYTMEIFSVPSRLSLNFNSNILFKQNYAVNESAFVKHMQNNFPSYFALLWDFLEPISVWVSRTHHKFDSDTFSLTSPVGTSSVNKHHLSLARPYTFEFQNVCFQSHWNTEQRSPFSLGCSWKMFQFFHQH